MKKIIFAINITIDGCIDHTAGIVDDQLHDFFTNMLNKSDTIVYGRKTYQLMEDFWPTAAENPEINDSMLRFANSINSAKKIVFSNTLENINWENTRLLHGDAVKEILKMKHENDDNEVQEKVISISGANLASSLMKMRLIDEYWFLVHPVIYGKGKRLFEDVANPFIDNKNINLKLIETMQLDSGVIVLHYIDDKSQAN